MAEFRESGRVGGKMVSLGGVEGIGVLGRLASSFQGAPSATALPILGDNPRRVAAIIQNTDAAGANDITVYLGGLTAIPLTLKPWGSLQIDANFPWTGAVYSQALVATTLVVTEISVQ